MQENMGYGDVPPHLVIFKNHEKANNYCTTSLKCITLNTNLFHAVHPLLLVNYIQTFLYLKFGDTSYSFK